MTGLSLSSLAIFVLALGVAAFSPGPGIAAIVGRVLGRGRDGAIAFVAGMAVGDVVWLTLAVTGLAMLAQTFGAAFMVVKYAGAAYLLFIATKMWRTPTLMQAEHTGKGHAGLPRLFLGGLAVTMGNPKAMVFYLALLPSLVDLARVDALAYAELATATLAVLAIVFGFYVFLALRARMLLADARSVRLLNRGSSLLMAGAAVAIAAR